MDAEATTEAAESAPNTNTDVLQTSTPMIRQTPTPTAPRPHLRPRSRPAETAADADIPADTDTRRRRRCSHPETPTAESLHRATPVSPPTRRSCRHRYRAAAKGPATKRGGNRVFTRQGRRPHLSVTIGLSTLAGLDNLPGSLAGYGAIPAGLARSIAASAATINALITDPDTGTGHRRRRPDLPTHPGTPRPDRRPAQRVPVPVLPATRLALRHGPPGRVQPPASRPGRQNRPPRMSVPSADATI